MLRLLKCSVMGLAVLTMLSTVVLAQEERQQRRRGGFGQQGGRGQGGRGGFGFGGGRGGGGGASIEGMRMQLLGVSQVKEEIDLLPDQEDDIKKAQEEMRNGLRGGNGGERPDFRNMSEEERNKFFTEMRARMEKASKKLNEKVEEILLPPQVDRLDEIAMQVLGARAVLADKVIKELKVSAAQKKEIETAQQKGNDEMRAKMTELFRGGGGGGDRDAIRAQFTKMREEMNVALLKPLSADQKKKFEEMKGEPFKMPEGALRGGGRGGRGGGPGGAGGRGGRPGRPGGEGGRRPTRPNSDDDR